MNDTSFDSNPPPPPEPAPIEPLGWLDIWGYAISKPSVATFKDLLQDPKANLSPYLWVGLSLLLAYLLQVGLGLLFGVSTYSMLASRLGDSYGLMGSMTSTAPLFFAVCCAPFSALLGVLGFFLTCGVYHLLAKLFGGEGTLHQVAFTASTFYVPLTVISAVLGSLPMAGPFLAVPVSIYMLVLFGVAINAVHGIGGGRSALVILIPIGIFLLMVILLGIVFISVISPFLQQVPGGINPYTY